MTTREEQLVEVAWWALRYFTQPLSVTPGTSVALPRELQRVLDLYEDIAPMNDAAKREWLRRKDERAIQDAAEVWARR